MKLLLRTLCEQDEAAFLAGLNHWVGEDPAWYSFIWKEGMRFTEMLEILRKEELGQELQPGRVPHTMLYGFLNSKIVGRVSVRHTLNENLLKRGGHIGYSIAPKFRRKGYATEILRQALSYCKDLGLSEILITCADNNVPSCRLIEKFEGKLENKIWDNEKKEMTRRYWLTLN